MNLLSPMATVAGQPIDYVIVAVYFVGILAFGSIFGRHTRSTKDFFFGGQRFGWWVIAISLVSTTVGSYSFIKYSRVAYLYGMSATTTYLNDWFWMPLLLFLWLPIIYFGRVGSIPEYFERRFNRRVRGVATTIILIYLVGYVGINLYTVGLVLADLAGWDIFLSAAIIGVTTAIYVTAGGQTAVIMTDLAQGLMLLIAGVLIFWLGIEHVGGLSSFWSQLPPEHKFPLYHFNRPPEFNFIGVSFQDTFSQGVFAYFLNQGMVMRFLSLKSVREGRKAILSLLLFLQLIAALAVAGAGFIGAAMSNAGTDPLRVFGANFYEDGTDANSIFIIVAEILCRPGVFGFVLAALTAALMSTADALINAAAGVFINDVYRPFLRPGRSDKHYLGVARGASLVVAVIGIAMVPVFMSFKSIYAAHAAFTGAVGPPLVVALLLAICWKRYASTAALWTVLGGTVAVGISMIWPDILAPFSFGVPREGSGATTWFYQRALFGIVVSGAIGVGITLLRPSPKRDPEALVGLVWGTLKKAQERFKGGPLNDERPGKKKLLEVRPLPAERLATLPQYAGDRLPVLMAPADLAVLEAREGDLVYLAHPNRLYGGLRAFHAVAGPPSAEPGIVWVPDALMAEGGLVGISRLRAEKTM